MFFCCKCCVLSGRSLFDELITRPEESYRLSCVVVCDLETSWMRRSWPTGGCCANKKNILPKTAVCRILFPLQTANVAYFQRKIQLSEFSAYPDGSSSELSRISGVLLYEKIKFQILVQSNPNISSRTLRERESLWTEISSYSLLWFTVTPQISVKKHWSYTLALPSVKFRNI